MARYRFYSVLQAMNGDFVSGANISVYISGTNNPARVYLVKEGGDPIDEPPQLQSDGSGRVEFWIDLMDYSPQTRFRIEAVKDNWLAVLDDVKIVEEDRYVYIQSSEPADKWIGVQWFDTSYSPPLLKVWNGSSWVVGGADVLDGAITAAKIASGVISTLHFASDAVAPDADKVDGYHASQTPTANTIPVAKNDGKLDIGWLPVVGTRMAIFTSSSFWDVPSDVFKIWVLAVGGGGGGGGARASGNNPYWGRSIASGGYGGTVQFAELNVSSGETLTITIGAGGAGGSSSNNGGNGGDTTIVGSVSGSLLSCSGGTGGRGASASASSSDVTSIASGRAGVFAIVPTDQALYIGGEGGVGIGEGGYGGFYKGSSFCKIDGSDGRGYGCGGGGAIAGSNSSSVYSANGGAGSAGIVIIWY